MAPPPPTRKVSNLVSFFEAPAPAPAESSSISRPAPISRVLSATLPLTPTPTTPAPPAPLPSSSTAKVVRSGTVSTQVRRFSLPPSPPPVEVDQGTDLSARGKRPEVRGRMSSMDWTERPRDSDQLISSARARAKAAAVPPTTDATAARPVPVETKVTGRQRPDSRDSFKPGRITPTPPPQMSTPSARQAAKPVVVPASVTSSGYGTKIEMATKNAGKVAKDVDADPIPAPAVKPSTPPVPLPPSTSTSEPLIHAPPRKPATALPTSSPAVQPPPSASSPSLPVESVVTLAERRAAPPDERKPVATSPTTSSNPTTSIPAHNPPISVAHAVPPETSRPLSTTVVAYPPSRPDPLQTPPPSSPHHKKHRPTHLSTPSPTKRSPDSTHSSRPSTRSSPASTRTTTNLPAADLFGSSAKPLVLAVLDNELKALAPPSFSRLSDVLSEEELPGWKDWVAASKEGCFAQAWHRLRGVGSKPGGKYVDVEKQGKGETATGDRHLIFPPMHLVSPSLTVTDLKLNRTKSRSLVTLTAFMSTVMDAVIAGEGSSIGIGLETLECFTNVMQMVSLIMTDSAALLSKIPALKAIFVTLPAVISLDFVSAFGHAIIWLWVFTLVAFFAVYELWRFTGKWSGVLHLQCDPGEGLDRDGSGTAVCPTGWRNSRHYKMGITFLASALYLPLSKLAIGAMAWTSDFWPVPNPYLTTDNPVFVPLGDPTVFYAPDAFCYKTTMLIPSGIHNFNWAYVILPVAISTLFWLTFFLPWRIYNVVKAEAPRVDKYTELGELRKDTTGEYERLLDEDTSPFSFLYHEYRRPWCYFKALYMLVKLVNILIVVLLTKNNCIFRSHSTSSLGIIRESTLLAFMTLFLLADTISKPFLEYISNNSDRVSRIGFVAIALIGLLVALNVPGESALGGMVLIIVEVVTYTFNVYFAVIGTDFVQRWVKRMEYRLDFSIDLFSPKIDLAKHVSRRIWQETITTILLAAPDFKMAGDEKLVFSSDSELPPQLLGFRGTQAERHIENLKILRTIGLIEYHKAMLPHSLEPDVRLLQVRREVQCHCTGPDIFWHPRHPPYPSSVNSFFGRLDVYAFPFVCVFRYDEDPSSPIALTELGDLELLLRQNESNSVLQRRRVRLALRALEGQAVFAPYTETRLVGVRHGVQVQGRIQYRVGALQISRNSDVTWRGYRYGSGFRVTIAYGDGQGQDSEGELLYDQRLTVEADALGIPSDFSLSAAVAKLFHRNRAVIQARLPQLENLLKTHREYFFNLAEWKQRTLSHSFLFDVVAEDGLPLKELEHVVQTRERDENVQNLVSTHRGSIVYLEERMNIVNRSQVHQWWFVLWDDLWRRNSASITLLGKQPAHFSPHYRTSIAYRPMARRDLEDFLHKRGFWTLEGKWGFFNTGFLNQIYFYLDEISYTGTSDAIPIHFGPSEKPVEFHDLEVMAPTRKRPQGYERVLPNGHGSRLSEISRVTGDGTSHDDWVIRSRLAFPFEEMYDRPAPLFVSGDRWNWFKDLVVVRIGGSAKTWLGLRPIHHDNRPSAGQGVTLDLRKGKEGWELPRRRHH